MENKQRGIIMSALEQRTHGFVGRAKECRQLGKLFEESLDWGARMVLVGGDTGIGKTSLLEQLEANVKVRGGHYLVCKSGLLGSSFPYHPLAELLRILIQDLGQSHVKEIISSYSPRVLSELSLLVPKFAPLFNNAVKGFTFTGQLSDKLFIENACSIVRDLLSKTPVVLVIEDIPYADPTTLEVIQHFVYNPDDFPMLICGTYDLDDIDLSGTKFSPFRNFVRALSYEDNLVKINLAPFTRDETEEYLTRLLPSKVLTAGLSDIVYQKSEGNPLVIKHLVEKLLPLGLQEQEQSAIFFRPWEMALPEEIAELFQIRLDGIRPELRSILATASVIGRRFTAETLALLLDRSLVDLLPLLEDAIKLKLIQEHQDLEGCYFTFGSARLQEVLYESISYQRKIIMHEQIGILLEQTTDPRVHPDEFAYHFQWGSDKAKAVKYGILAGQRAISLYAFHSAWRYFSSAKDLLTMLDKDGLEQFSYPVLEGLAESSSYLGYYKEAWKCLGQLLGTGIPKGSEEYASVQSKLGQLCFRMGNYAESLEHYRLALESGGRDGQKSMVIHRIIQAYVQMGKFEEAQSLAEMQLKRAEKSGHSEVLREITTLLTLLHLYMGNGAVAEENAQKVNSQLIHNDMARLANVIILGQLAMDMQTGDRAEAILNEGLNLAKKIQDPLVTGEAHCLLAKLQIVRGKFPKAKQRIERVKSLEVYTQSFFLKANISYLETILVLLGENPTGKETLRVELEEIWTGRLNSAFGASALACQAELASSNGETEHSKILLEQAAAVQALYATPRNLVHLLRANTAHSWAAGNKEKAKGHIREILKCCQEHGMLSEALITYRLWPDLIDSHSKHIVLNKFGINVEESKKTSESNVSLANCLPQEVALVLDFIHCQFASDISIASLCRIASLSERQLRRIFTQYTGVSLKEYINSYRIEKAKELLLNPTLGVSQVGELVGLVDRSHFCKTFKALTGVSPSEFRKTQTENV